MHSPSSVRFIREAILAQSRATSVDPVAADALRADVRASVAAMRISMDRALEFAARGLVGEAASIIADYPDLARQALTLASLPRESPLIEEFWRTQIDIDAHPLALPTSEEIERLAAIELDAERLRPIVERMRTAALRGEPITARLQLLKQLREADPRNRMWLDQIAMLEREWIKRLGELAGTEAERVELEEALGALATRSWLASVPAGLKEALYAKVRPLRAAQAGERYAALAEEIHRASSLMDRTALERLEGEWASVYHDTGRMPDEALQAGVAPCFEWLSAVAREESDQREFDARVEALDRALDARRPWTEIDLQIAGLRDAGRSVPAGVLSRANEWIRAEQDRLRRRHRLVLAAGVAAAIVVALGTTLAIVMWSRATAARSAAESLEARIAAEDEPGARALAAEIRSRPELASVEVAAALGKAEKFAKDWAARRVEHAAATARMRSTLEAPAIARAEHATIESDLKRLQSEARTDEEREASSALVERFEARRRAQDDGDRALVDSALRDHESRLSAWKLPDRWSDAEQADLARWDRYLEALETSKGALERVQADVDGFESQQSRFKLPLEGVAARAEEARTRRQELSAALAAISHASIGKPVAAESVFVERLDGVLGLHAATLQRLGQIAGWERAKQVAAAWLAIQDWREGTRPRLAASLGPALAGMPSTDQRDATIAIVQEHLSRFPDSPYRDRADELLRRMDPGARERIWEPAEVARNLQDARYADLEEVPLRSGGHFYRRPSATRKDPMHRAVDSLVELREDPDSLGAMILSGGDSIDGPVRRSAVSRAWGDAFARSSVANPGEIASILTEMLATLAKGTEGDSLFRIRALRDGAEIGVRSGHLSRPVATVLESWLDVIRRDGQDTVSVDWTRTALADNAEVRGLRRKAVEFIRRFPSIEGLVGTAADEQRRLGAQLAALAPIGVALPAAANAVARPIAGDPPGRPLPDCDAVVLVRDGTRWRMHDVKVREGAVPIEGIDVPAGPFLVFRRVTQ